MVGAQAHHKFFNGKDLKIGAVQADYRHEFLLELFLRAVDVGVVHLHGSDPHQAKELAAFLVAVAGAVFGQPDRQIAVGARFAGVDFVVEGAVHWLDIILDPFQFHWGVHAFGVVGQVSAAQEEILFGKMGGFDALVAGAQFGFGGQFFQF